MIRTTAAATALAVAILGCGPQAGPRVGAAGAGGGSLDDLATEDLPPGAVVRFGTIRFRWRGVPEELVFTPDGTKLVGISLDPVVRVWDARSGRRVLRLGDDATEDSFLAGAVSPDSKLVAVGGYGDVVVVWNLDTGAEVQTVGKDLRNPRRLAFSPDGRSLAIAAEGELVVYDTKTWKETHRDQYGDFTPTVFRFTADGRLLAASGYDGGIADVLTAGAQGVALVDLPAKAGPGAIPHDGTLLAVGDAQLAIHLYAVATGAKVRTLASPVATRTTPLGYEHLEFSADDRTLAGAATDAGAWLLPVDGGAPRELGDRGAFAIGWSADGASVATDTVSSTIQLFRAADGHRLDALPGHEHELTALAVSADGTVLVTAGRDHTVRLWDARSGALQRTIATGDTTPYAVAMSPDGTRVFVGLDRPIVKVVDAATGRELRVKQVMDHGYITTLVAHPGGVLAVAASDGVAFLDPDSLEPRQGTGYFGGFSMPAGVVSPDGRVIATRDDGQLVTFDRDGGRSFSGDEWPLPQYNYVVAWSPDGRSFLIAREDGQLELTPVSGGAPTLVMMQPVPVGESYGHRAPAAAAFSPDGTVLATGGHDGRITLWQLPAGTVLRTLVGHEETVDALVFSPDGHRLYSASRDTTALAWEL